ncbi:alpha-D-ribose 1-methylphosphonate 5-triphosphate synthase subunit PhnH [Peptococcaceae bacterium CEB3]|nr:alpha-D-ribose 1-methylphosphonate 5-triphosphate synthase subunit PhnH [Peptococcaceae bacterium CEB3]
MNLDLVHDLQAVYRKTLASMSCPGLISNIREQAGKLDWETGCFSSTVLLILMLLDTEKRFKVYSEQEEATTWLINQLTYAQATETEQADFVLVLNTARVGDLEEALRRANPGNLLNPHKGATVFVEADALSGENELILCGPGIAGASYISVRTKGSWIEARAAKNFEYPLGVDLIFTDSGDNVLCLPRTTQIARQEVG